MQQQDWKASVYHSHMQGETEVDLEVDLCLLIFFLLLLARFFAKGGGGGVAF